MSKIMDWIFGPPLGIQLNELEEKVFNLFENVVIQINALEYDVAVMKGRLNVLEENIFNLPLSAGDQK